MTLRINTNIAALNAQKNLNITDKALSKSIEKLTTGKELNTSGDDASAMAIADILQSNVLGLEQAQKNITDAISMLQIADGALEESINIVNTIKQKSIQSAQDAQSLESRKALQADVTSLLEELDVIANTTNFNGKKLLSGNFINKSFQIGSSAGETASLSISSALPKNLGYTNVSDLTLSDDGGRVRLAIYSSTKGETFFLEEVDVGYYGHLNDGNEKSMQALADVINKSNDDYNVTATAEVVSTSSSLVKAGTIEKGFKINGVEIGEITIVDGDSDGVLVNAINTQTVNTHVKASLNSRGNLVLTSLDGRSIKLEADSITNKTNTGINGILGEKASEMSTLGKIVLQQRGAARVIMENVGSGNAINVSGTGIEFGTFYAERDSTLKSGTVIDGGSILAEGFTIGQDIGAGTGTTGASTEDLTALFNVTNVTTTSDSTLKSGSIIYQGTQLAAGSVVGTNMDLTAAVSGISEGTLAVGSTIKTGSIIGGGTALGVAMKNSNAFTTLSGTLKGSSSIISHATAGNTSISSSAVLASNATLTIPAAAGGSWRTSGSTTFETSQLTLTGDGTKTIGELLVEKGLTSANIEIGATQTIAINGQFKGSITNVAVGSTIGVGSILDQNITTQADAIVEQTMTLAGSSTLATDSILKNGSTINQAFVLKTTTVPAVGDGETTLKSGSTLVVNAASKITSGSTIGAKLTVNDTAGHYIRVTGDTGFAVKAGTTLKECTTTSTPSATVAAVLGNGSDIGGSLVLAKDEVVGTSGMRVAADSVLYKGTVLKEGTHLLNDFTATDGTTYKAYSVLQDDITLASSHTLSSYQVLKAGSTITANSTLKPQTQGLTYATANLGSETVLRLSEINILDAEGAQNAIVVASSALINLDEVRAEIGATYQRLTTTEVNIATTTINLSAAESAIRDVDFSAETSNLSRLKILSRTGTYALQQANASAEAVLELLQ